VKSTTSVELQRTIFANRAQAYICYRNIYTALHDINLALSPRYTNAQSPTALTTKCRFQRAKLLCKFAKYSEALSEYEELIKLRTKLSLGIMDEDRELQLAIDEGMKAPQRSERRQKDELMRAVDVCPIKIFVFFYSVDLLLFLQSRGIIIQAMYRSNFPVPPSTTLQSLDPDFDPDEMCLTFDTDDGRPHVFLSNPNKTPITLPIYIVAPFFQARQNTVPNAPGQSCIRECHRGISPRWDVPVCCHGNRTLIFLVCSAGYALSCET
jgi:hypothetical protein